MSNVVLIDTETGRPDEKLPKYLAQSALLARNAHALGDSVYKCPKTGQDMKIHLVQSKNSEEPGVLLSYKGRNWECWSRGLSKRGQEYFGIRVRDPMFFGKDGDQYQKNPYLIAYGNLFVNIRNNEKSYTLSLVSPTLLAKRELAKKIESAGLATQADISKIDVDIEPGQIQPRTSTVRLG